MNKILTFFISIFCLTVAFPGFHASAQSPEEALEKLLKSPSIDPSTVSVVIADLEDGSLLAAHNADKGLIPASIMKSATTAALIGKKTKNEPIVTTVHIDGPVDEGVLNGNIVIVASGDPSLNGNDSQAKSADFVEEIALALREKGIHTVAGKIIIDESVFDGPAIPESWQTADLQYSYGTGSHGFNFERNSVNKSSVKDPAGTFRKKLKTRLSKGDISLNEEEIESGKQTRLLEHRSAPLHDIMRSCMVRSDNLYAECFMRMFGLEHGHDGSTAKGAEAAMKSWEKAGLPMENVLIVDGSGLSRQNRLTGRFMTMMLTKMKGNKDYVDLFARVGKEGTVAGFLKGTNLEGKLALKTGSMKGVQCYAGYLLNEKGKPEKTILIMANNLKDRARFKQDLAKYFLEIF